MEKERAKKIVNPKEEMHFQMCHIIHFCWWEEALFLQ